MIACNCCNAARAGHAHPCDNCGSFEYRLTGQRAVDENRLGRVTKKKTSKRKSGAKIAILAQSLAIEVANAERQVIPRSGVTPPGRDRQLFFGFADDQEQAQ